MLPNPPNFDPTHRDLKADILKRLRNYGITDRVFGVVQSAYDDALMESGVVLNQTEKKRMLRDVLKEILAQMIQDL